MMAQLHTPCQLTDSRSHEAAAKAESVYVTSLVRSDPCFVVLVGCVGIKSNSSTTLQPSTRTKSIGCACKLSLRTGVSNRTCWFKCQSKQRKLEPRRGSDAGGLRPLRGPLHAVARRRSQSNGPRPPETIVVRKGLKATKYESEKLSIKPITVVSRSVKATCYGQPHAFVAKKKANHA